VKEKFVPLTTRILEDLRSVAGAASASARRGSGDIGAR
jgi:hypothetical protein